MEEVVKPMFDLVQERDLGPKISSRTMVYLVSHGQPEDIGSDKLGERGRRQVSELAYSRMIAGISRIYSSRAESSRYGQRALAAAVRLRHRPLPKPPASGRPMASA